MAKTNLSIYLIKKGITNFNDIVENDSLKWDSKDFEAFYSKSVIMAPRWMKSFFMSDNEDLKTANSRAVFLKKINISETESRIFAITFGYGKNLLKDNVYEEQFGLKIVLNTIDPLKIRKISKTDIGKNYKQSQEQMPRESGINDFGFDVDRDLIKGITGKSNDEQFDNAIISGSDYFNLVIERDITNIDGLLYHCYEKYLLTTYKNSFEWIDNIKLIKDELLIEQLNNEVVDILNKRDFTKIWVAIPEMINWEQVHSIYIEGQKDKNAEYTDIDNNVFVDSFKNSRIMDFKQIKSKNVIAKSTENIRTDMKKWRADKCLVGSIEMKGQVYAINGGYWYRIDNEFAMKINESYNKIPLSDIPFMECHKTMNEDSYNQLFIDKTIGAHLIHKYKIPIGGGKGNNIEPCDIAIGKTLIHIKNNGGSSYLSHLFNQATVSCSALKDPGFRMKFQRKLENDGVTDVIGKDFNASEYTVVLGIINKDNSERPVIPFFSKVSIKYAQQQINNLGYNFALKNIHKTEV